MANPRVYSKYIPAKGHGVNNLRVDLYYSLGGMNYFTYKSEARGYYLSVTPVEVSDHNGYKCESTVLMSGIKKLIKEVSRQSQRAANEAAELAKGFEEMLIDYVCRTEGVEVLVNG